MKTKPEISLKTSAKTPPASLTMLKSRNRGFALVVTLSLMILLTILAVGLLSLSSVSLRNSTAESAANRAKANAELAMMMALGQLQETLGDDRRISADASILSGATPEKQNAVGVWNSWSPRLAENPGSTAAPDYAAEKGDTSGTKKRFERWLISANDPVALTKVGWANAGSLAKPEKLFTVKSDGFDLAGEKVDVEKGTANAGSYAWAITQENTRAKINVGGPETGQMVAKNDILQSQPRPGLGLSKALKQPQADWNLRASRVISIDQSKLDADLINDPTVKARADFTTQSMGLLTDVVNGGFKTDLSLGFEMSDADFDNKNWGGGLKNPFTSDASPKTAGASSYKNQRPLFKPLTQSGSLVAPLRFDPANAQFDVPANAVPTFHTLRSFYRSAYHLYDSTEGLTVFERGMDHVAITANSILNQYFQSPSRPPQGNRTQTGYRPIVDRVMFAVSAGISINNKPALFITPYVTLWNPYDVALEIEGAIAYPWLDFPFGTNWRITQPAQTGRPAQTILDSGAGLANVLGEQLRSFGHGRSISPFFYAAITPNGAPVGSGSGTISFKPGEVRLFVPQASPYKLFNAGSTISNRTTYLKPVENANDLGFKGGLSFEMFNPLRSGENLPFKNVILNPQEEYDIRVSFNSAGSYPFVMSMEDSTLAKGSSLPSQINNSTRRSVGGQSIVDVFAKDYAKSFTRTITTKFSRLKTEPVPICVIELYHLVANSGTSATTSDIAFTGNPRQSSMFPFVSNTTFESGPQYRLRMRSINSPSEMLETTSDGRSAFYGPVQGKGSGSSKGENFLSFFEVPRAPMLSLAAFQHADLSPTPFSTSYQFANSWASPYISAELVSVDAKNRSSVVDGNNVVTGPEIVTKFYDYSYLANEALWDGFFFSGAAPTYNHVKATGSPAVWQSSKANISLSLSEALGKFLEDPISNPLRNPRMRLLKNGKLDSEILNDLTSREGCLRIAEYLMVDGSFNVNSTSVEAWVAVLSGMRKQSFDVTQGASPSGNLTSFPRLTYPIGAVDNNWQGFRALSDVRLRELAVEIIRQVKQRGPFLSLAEFVNRRVGSSSDLTKRGALEAAIENASAINENALFADINTSSYPSSSRANVSPAKTGVGIPGYLTQADVLKSIAPSLTVRSDTFTIRGYGEARDRAGNLLAVARCEAVVQRSPKFLDGTNQPDSKMDDLTITNRQFGRKFEIVSFRFLSSSEVAL